MAKKSVKAVCRNTQGDFSDRRYIVGYVPNGGRDNPSPAIYLGGRWLEACGFLTGQYVTVSAEPGQLVIKPAPSSLPTCPPPANSKMGGKPANAKLLRCL